MCQIFFLGDVYLNSMKIYQRLEFSQEVVNIFSKCDYVCYNLEGALTERKDGNKSKIGPIIKQDINRVEKLNELIGTSKVLCNLANNHIMDYFEGGLVDTINKLSGRCFGAGATPFTPRVISSNGRTLGLLAVAEGGFGAVKFGGTTGYAWFMHECIDQVITELKKRCDYVLILSHAGLEGIKAPLPEIRRLYRRYIDYGADIVIAHHPHMIQGMEYYNYKPIYYSLGNFMFDRLDGNGEYNGNSIGVLLELDEWENPIVVPLRYQDGLVSISQKSMEFFNEANAFLKEEEYDSYITEKCIEFYQDVSKKYYRQVCGSSSKFYNWAKSILECIGKDQFNEDWLYHNLAIESNYWATVRGMEWARIRREYL